MHLPDISKCTEDPTWLVGMGGLRHIQNHLLQIDSMSHCVQWLPVPPSNCKKKENQRGNNLLDLSSIQQKCLLNSWRLIKYWKYLPCNWNLKKCQNYFLQNESDVKERSRLCVLWGILSSFISCIMLAFWSLNIVYVMSLYNLVYKLLCVQLRPWTVQIRFHSGHVHGQTLKQRYWLYILWTSIILIWLQSSIWFTDVEFWTLIISDPLCTLYNVTNASTYFQKVNNFVIYSGEI